MYWDRFDICEAWYLALSHCHSGMGSEEYRRLCHMDKFFEPSPILNVDSLTENSREIYEAACEKLLRRN